MGGEGKTLKKEVGKKKRNKSVGEKGGGREGRRNRRRKGGWGVGGVGERTELEGEGKKNKMHVFGQHAAVALVMYTNPTHKEAVW